MGGKNWEPGLGHLSSDIGVDPHSSPGLLSRVGKAGSSEGVEGGYQGDGGVGTLHVVQQDCSPCPKVQANRTRKCGGPPMSAFY